MQLSRSQTRAFVAAFAGLALVLSVAAAVLITRGWADDDVQRQVEAQETERRLEMPRFQPDTARTP